MHILSMSRRFLANYGWLILALVVSFYLGRHLTTPDHFHTHDDIQVFRTNEFINCFRDGQLPCRWSRDLGKGYGYPLFIFYPPMIYLLPSLLIFITKIPITYALNLVTFFTFPLAAYSMYRLIMVLSTQKNLAGLAGILYSLLPYHAVNVFVRGVYAENLVWAIIPLLFAEVYLVIKKNKPFWTLSILLALTVLSHNISAMLVFPLLLAWGVALILSNWKKYHLKLMSGFSAGVLGISLSAFFLIPLILEKPLVQTESMIFDYYSYLVHFPSIKQIFFNNYWGYGGSSWGVKDDGMSFALGQVHWVGLIIGGLAALFYHKKKLPVLVRDPIIISTSLSLLFVLFLSHPRSTPIWENFQFLQYIQFPWRLVGLAGFFTVMLLSYFLTRISHKVALVLGTTFAILAFSMYGGFFRPEKYDGLTDQDFITGNLRSLQQQDHLFDYLPKTVKSVPDFAKDLVFTSFSPISYEVLAWNSNQAKLKINSPELQTVTFSIFAYPGWELFVNNQPQGVKIDPQNGLIMAEIPTGPSEVLLEFKDTTSRRIGSAISFVAIGVLILGTITSYKQKKYATKK